MPLTFQSNLHQSSFTIYMRMKMVTDPAAMNTMQAMDINWYFLAFSIISKTTVIMPKPKDPIKLNKYGQPYPPKSNTMLITDVKTERTTNKIVMNCPSNDNF